MSQKCFLHSELNEDQLSNVVIDGALADILIQANGKYAEFSHVTKSCKRVMYLKQEKALYGTLTAARLFVKNLIEKLEKIGFKLNPCDIVVLQTRKLTVVNVPLFGTLTISIFLIKIKG